MSVDYRASIIKGWKIDRNMWEIAMNSEDYDYYCIHVDSYSDDNYGLFFGRSFCSAEVGDYETVDNVIFHDKDIEELMTAYIDVFKREPTYPRTYLLCEAY